MIEEYLTTKELAAVAKKSAPFILKRFVSIGNSQYEKILVNTELCFTKYLQRYYSYYSKIRTLLYRDSPVSLKDHYVQTNFTYKNTIITKNNVFPTLNKNKKNVIFGTAGAGKSVFIKRFFLDLVDSDTGYIPILIELRLLKQSKDEYISILDYAFKMLRDLDSSFTITQLKYALNNGKIALLLDGFDEVDYEKREIYSKEILKLSMKYNNSLIVITSRPDEIFDSWNEFHVLRANRLQKEEAIELISKINYVQIVKDKFIDELDKYLFDKHIDFTSNPLLLTMMLLTYEQLAEIPEKIHIFYGEAFNTLFHKHDAYKEMFKRKFYSKLAIDDFKRMFATFCILTYSDKKLSFSSSELKTYINHAIKLESIQNEKASNIIKDLTESICILQKDGQHYTFSHRSFQEYFTAYYISNTNSIKDMYKLLDKILIENSHDNVLYLLKEMNLELIEQKFVLKKMKEYIRKLKKINLKKEPYKFFQTFITEIKIRDSHINDEISFWVRTDVQQNIALYFFRYIDYISNMYNELNKIQKDKQFIDILKKEFNTDVLLINEKGNNISNEKLNHIFIQLNYHEKFESLISTLEDEFITLEDKYTNKKEDLASFLF